MKHKLSRYLSIVLTLILLSVVVAFAATGAEERLQTENDEGLEMLLFMDVPEVTVSTRFEEKATRVPNIISVITEQEIKDMGARDLIDVLRTVPGFNFGADIDSLLGVSLRGIWIFESRALFMINGQRQNDIVFGLLNVGNRFSLHGIKRIEIVRGPGSAIYGGMAEVAVVNIITKNGADIGGGDVEAHVGTFEGKELNQKGIEGSFGKSGQDWDYALHFGYKLNDWARGEHSDILGTTLKINGNDIDRDLFSFVGQGHYKDFQVNTFVNTHKNFAPDGFFSAYDPSEEWDNLQWATQFKNDFSVNENFKITPGYNFQWDEVDINKGIQFPLEPRDLDRHAEENKLFVDAIMSFSENNNLVFGSEYVRSTIQGTDSNNSSGRYRDFDTLEITDEFSLNKWAAYIQDTFKWETSSFTVGVRYDNHEQFGNSLSPRAGITFGDEQYNLKILYGESFKEPMLENIGSIDFGNPNLEAEEAKTYEIEAEYKLSNHIKLKSNIFKIQIDTPIIFGVSTVTPTGLGYVNLDKLSSNGFESELLFEFETLYYYLKYSYNDPVGNTDGAFLTTDEDQFLSFPNHNVNGGINYQLTQNVFLGSTLNYIGKRESQQSLDIVSLPLDETFLWNANIQYKSAGNGQDFSITFSVHDILDEQFVFAQPYYGVKRELIGPGRNYTLRFGIKI